MLIAAIVTMLTVVTVAFAALLITYLTKIQHDSLAREEPIALAAGRKEFVKNCTMLKIDSDVCNKNKTYAINAEIEGYPGWIVHSSTLDESYQADMYVRVNDDGTTHVFSYEKSQ